MGTTSTTVTANWTAVQDAPGFPTEVSGDDVKTYINTTTPPFGGEAWSDVDLMDAIPTGATLVDLDFTLTVQVDGSRELSGVPINPAVQFIDKAEYLAHSFFLGYGQFAAGGVGNLPDDNDPHALDYLNSDYQTSGGGAGIFDIAAFAAALADVSTPVIARVLAPQGGATGTGITYFAPLTLTFTWELAGPTVAPPLRLYPRADALGASSARRVYPIPPTVQASNRRGPSAIL